MGRLQFEVIEPDSLFVCLTVLQNDIPHIFAMTLFEEYIYWTDWETKSINRAHKSMGTNKTTLISTLHRPMDIHIYHPYRQPQGKRVDTCRNYTEQLVTFVIFAETSMWQSPLDHTVIIDPVSSNNLFIIGLQTEILMCT